MRVLIAVPTFESIMPDTYKAIWDMDKGGHECDFEFVRGYDCATARNKIAQKALDGGYDYLLMVDNDVTPPKDALVNLIGHGVDMVSGFYPHRKVDNTTCDRVCAFKLRDKLGRECFNYTSDDEYTKQDMAELREKGENLIEVHGTGMGCVLVRVDVFNRVPYPWFDWVNYNNAGRTHLSEDLFFCEALRKSGIPRHVDTRVGCGHMFRHVERAI